MPVGILDDDPCFCGVKSPSHLAPRSTAMTNDPLPTPKQREMLCDMIHHAFVELRILGWGGHSEQAADLADAFHNISKEMYGWGGFRWETFRTMLEDYQHKWRSKGTGSGRDYVEMLDEIQLQRDA